MGGRSVGKIYTLNPGSKAIKESIRPPGRYVAKLRLAKTEFNIEEGSDGYVFCNCPTVAIPPWWPEFARREVRQILLDDAYALQDRIANYITVHNLTMKPDPGWRPQQPKLASIHHLPGPVINDGLPGLLNTP